MTPDDAIKARLDFLRADFVATKAEIARRSDLQRYASLAYLGVIGFIVQQLPKGVDGLMICGLWGASVVALLFIAREQDEVMRLSGTVIKRQIAPTVRKIIGYRCGEHIIPSETARRHTRLSGCLQVCFDIAAFILTPGLVTVFWLMTRSWETFASGITIFGWVLGILLALFDVILIGTHHGVFRKKRDRSCPGTQI